MWEDMQSRRLIELIQMGNKKTNEIMATATIAIALSAVIQSISIYNQFKVEDALDYLALIAMSILLLMITGVALRAWGFLNK